MARIIARKNLILGLVSLALMMVLGFQNCSGGEGEGKTSSAAAASVPSQVGVINQVRPLNDWSLSSAKIEVANGVNVLSVSGSCEGQEYGRMRWELQRTASGATAVSESAGQTQCLGGKFALDLSPLRALPCGEKAKLVGSVGAQTEVLAEVIRRCEAQKIEAPSLKNSLVADSLKAASVECAVEVSQAGCAHVCYDEQGVVTAKTDLEGAICGQ